MAITVDDILDVRMNDDGTPFIGPNGFEFVTGLDGARQLCLIALRLLQEEWFLNRDKGMPWFQEILGQKNVESVARARAVEVLLDVVVVQQVLQVVVTFDNETRHMSIIANVQTIWGDLIEVAVSRKA